MGSKIDKESDTVINDYTKVKIPNNCSLIKLGSYNVNLRNTINVNTKIKDIMAYIECNHKSKVLDIITLQGIYDSSSLYGLVRECKRYFMKNKMKVYFAPNFDSIEVDNVSSKKKLDLSFNASSGSENSHNKKKMTHNIIISKYPILSTIYAELDDNTDMDDILGIQTVIGANILIGNHIISIYNTALSKDIRSANIINSSVRRTELDSLMNIIDKNKITINDQKFSQYAKSDVHLICGTMNINEHYEVGSNDDNSEYMELIKSRKCIDIFRYLNENDKGYTTSYKERINYILLNLTDDIFDDTTKIYDDFQKIKIKSQLFDLLFDRYKTYFLDYYTIKNDSTSTSIYYPIECIFLIKN
jgi:hypothetical protein